MKNESQVGPIELLLLGVWLAVEAAAVLLVSAVALVMALAQAQAPPAGPPAHTPPAQHPLSLLAESLLALPQRELMAMAGTRRRLPKRLLIEQLLAMA